MRVVFMGTPAFAVTILRALSEAHEVVGVYSRPDSVSGRGAALRASAVKNAAVELGLAVYEPVTLRDPAAQEQLRSLRPDIVVVAAYGMILPREVLSVPPYGCVNVHASLLPRWRGAAPVQRAILEGDVVTGVSIMRMEEGLDTGAYCLQESIEICHQNADELTQALADLGAQALLRSLPEIEARRCEWSEQDDSKATYAEKITKADVALFPKLGITLAERRVRASSAQAPARAKIAGKDVTVTQVERSVHELGPGSVLSDRSGLHLGFVDGCLLVQRVKPDGKSEMAGADWARGLRLTGDECWEGTS